MSDQLKPWLTAAEPAVFDPLTPGFAANPYSRRRLRAGDPVHRSAQGYWVLTRATMTGLPYCAIRGCSEWARLARSFRSNSEVAQRLATPLGDEATTTRLITPDCVRSKGIHGPQSGTDVPTHPSDC